MGRGGTKRGEECAPPPQRRREARVRVWARLGARSARRAAASAEPHLPLDAFFGSEIGVGVGAPE